MRTFVILAYLLVVACSLCAQDWVTSVGTLTPTLEKKTRALNSQYLLFSPSGKSDEPLPLLIYLHGAGGVGDNIQKIRGQTRPLLAGIRRFARVPCMVVAPQCVQKTRDGGGWLPSDLDLLLAHLKATLEVDATRIYLTGNSMGGYGSWVWGGHQPDHFAAIAPISGGIGAAGPKAVSPDLARWASNLAKVPVYAFAGARDRVVPAERSERMIAAIREAGGKNARIKIYPEQGHDARRVVFANAEYYQWLFSHARESAKATQVSREKNLAEGHPWPSYDDVEDIGAVASALRGSLVARDRYSFSRGWWTWDRLRCRYVDGGRRNEKELAILAAVFRALILDWHAKLEAKGEGDLLYLFFTTVSGDKRERVLDIDERKLLRDLHGGGYHGSWGGAARMRIYQELANRGVLTEEEKRRFEKIVHQSLERRLIDFRAKAQTANNHSFGNAGGVALALRLFPDAPQADEARAWIDRIWKHLSDYGDWREWNYYPYGPIFLHGVLDVAEATGRIETDRELIRAVGKRCLDFVHGGGVRGNPNSGVRMRGSYADVYRDPWNHGYFDVEQSARDGHFWYRMAQHYRDPEYLWAAEQVALGGRPSTGKAPAAYQEAYERRFAWFVGQGIEPRQPRGGAKVGLLSALKDKVHERIFLRRDRGAEQPVTSFFLYDKKDEHLDNVSGHLYEYAARGAKLLHSSGKYNNVYSGDTLRGGGTGEESLDVFLVLHGRHEFPLHPDRQGDERDFLRRGSIRNLPALSRAENNEAGDAFGQFAFADYYGRGSRWLRRAVLTREGYLIIADEFVGGEALGDEYSAGPVWHLARSPEPEGKAGEIRVQERNWFDAPAFAHAWWQEKRIRVLLLIHEGDEMKFGQLRQSHSQDTDPNVTCFGWRPIRQGRPERFLSVFVPHSAERDPSELAQRIRTRIDESGEVTVRIEDTTVTVEKGSWHLFRHKKGVRNLFRDGAKSAAKSTKALLEVWDEEVPVMGQLAVACDGTVLLFKENRERGLVEVKRSVDGGKTWGLPIRVGERVKIDADMSDDGRYRGPHVGWSELGGVTVDESTGDILVFAGSLKPVEVLYRSRDHGKTWTAERITIRPDKHGWLATTYCCDPGVTLLHGQRKGRLLIPSQVFVGGIEQNGSRTYLNKGQNRRYFAKRYSNALYSDDGGKTWIPSEPFPILGTSEPGLVELRDGTIYYNARTHVRSGNKIVGESEDGGVSWTNAREDDELFDGPPDVYGCKGALLRLPDRERDILLFSGPGRRDKRDDITVWVSFDGGETWPLKRLVKKGPGNYTWLAAGREGTPSEGWVFLLSNKDWMARFNRAWLLGVEKGS